jgi:hypothetical protein
VSDPSDHAGTRVAPAWSELSAGAQAFRVAHAAFATVSLSSLAYVWLSAATRRRDRLLAGSLGVLLFEAVALAIGRGDCPFGPAQARLGDPVPLFELVLPPRAAKAAIPVLTLISVAGIVAMLARGPREIWQPQDRPDEGGVERETGFEPATSSLEGWRSTN